MFQLTVDTKVGIPTKQLPDGEYTAILTALEQPVNSKPYFVLTIPTMENRQQFAWINSAVSFEIMSRDINKQLGVESASDYITWFEDIKGSEVKFWITEDPTAVNPETGEPYHNLTFRKPVGFEDMMNGAL